MSSCAVGCDRIRSVKDVIGCCGVMWAAAAKKLVTTFFRCAGLEFFGCQLHQKWMGLVRNKRENLRLRLGLHAPSLLNTFSWNGQCRENDLELLTMILHLCCTVRATAWYCCSEIRNNYCQSVPSPVTYRDNCWLSAWLRRWRSCGARVSSWGDGVRVAVDWWL